jgi:Holliday junction resolvase RusA-like endonuclease
MSLAFTYLGTPIGKPRMTQSDKWRRPPRPEVARWFDFKTGFWSAAIEAGYRPQIDVILSVEATARIKFPKSYSRPLKNRLREQNHDEKPDVDNIQKAIADALTENDAKIYRSNVIKLWADAESLEVTLLIYRRGGAV